MGTHLGVRLDLSLGQGKLREGGWGGSCRGGLHGGGWGLDRSGSENPSRRRSPATRERHEEKGEEGLDVGEGGGEEGREEQVRGLEGERGLASLSLTRLNREWAGELVGGRCASGPVLPSASDPGRQHSRLRLDPADDASFWLPR